MLFETFLSGNNIKDISGEGNSWITLLKYHFMDNVRYLSAWRRNKCFTKIPSWWKKINIQKYHFSESIIYFSWGIFPIIVPMIVIYPFWKTCIWINFRCKIRISNLENYIINENCKNVFCLDMFTFFSGTDKPFLQWSYHFVNKWHPS